MNQTGNRRGGSADFEDIATFFAFQLTMQSAFFLNHSFLFGLKFAFESSFLLGFDGLKSLICEKYKGAG